MDKILDDEAENLSHSIAQEKFNCDEDLELQEQNCLKIPNSATEQVACSLKTICSETQRIARKSCLLLPYHKPKQRGLLEFLNRKKVCRSDKPTFIDRSGATYSSKLIKDTTRETKSYSESNDGEKSAKCESTNVSAEAVEANPFEESGSRQSFVSDVRKLEAQEAAEGQLHRPCAPIATSSTTTQVTERPKLHGRPGDVFELSENSTAILPSNCFGPHNFVESTSHEKVLGSRRISSDHGRKESNFEGTAETSQSAERSNETRDWRTDVKMTSSMNRHEFKEALKNSMSAKRAAIRVRKQQEFKSVDDELEEGEEGEEEYDAFDDFSGVDADTSLCVGRKSKMRKSRYYCEDKEDPDLKDISHEESLTNDLSCEIPSSATINEEANEGGCICAAETNFSPSESKTDGDAGLFSYVQTSHDGSFNELLALCSGTFSGNSMRIASNEPSGSSDNEGGYIGTTNSSDIIEGSNLSAIVSNVSSSEDEKSVSFNLPPNLSVQPLSTKRKKLLPLLLSDDEDEIDNDEDDRRSIASVNASESEELQPTDFFDEEAELSGSEIGSDDEREDEENEWEMEEGDKEDIDEDEIREQVGRSHLKTMLDDDQREIRLFQELFLEDGDLHSDGGGRKKQFKWNALTQGFGDEPTIGENNAEDHNPSEGPDEATWRRTKNEREKWLQEKGVSVMLDDMRLKTKNIRIVKTKTASKANALRSETQEARAEADGSLCSPTKNDAMLKVRRGSFLRRNDKELTEIASLSKIAQPVQAPTASSNFVFASVTPKRNAVNNEKRKIKVEDVGVENRGSGAPPNKKSKIKATLASVFSFL